MPRRGKGYKPTLAVAARFDTGAPLTEAKSVEELLELLSLGLELAEDLWLTAGSAMTASSLKTGSHCRNAENCVWRILACCNG